ncbi:MAG: hypothetical protein EP338_01855 [Bacteroidetes bacterium]|nr:MAG: hypothetical protein EP338_01855 [Bacteroidota bacterium]
MVGENFFKKYARFAFLAIIVFTTALAFFIKDLQFDYDFEKFFPADDEETTFYFKHRETFQSDNDFLLIAIENKEGIFQKEFLDRVESLRKKILKFKHVRFARAITAEEEFFLLAGGNVSTRPFYTGSNEQLREDSSRVYRHRELLNSLVADDAKSLCIYVKHDDYLPGAKSSVLIEKIQQEVAKCDFEKVRIAGRVIGQKFYIGKMGTEMALFVAISFLLVILFLWIAFKSIWGILLPQLVILFTMIWILGLMGLFGIPVNIILSILPSIMFVVGMSDVIHLVSRYLDALRNGRKKWDAIRISIREVGMATLLTSITTCIGFVTLMTISVQPIRTFGLVTGIGVLIAFLVTILVLPLSFYIFPSPKKIIDPKNAPFWNNLLQRSFLFVLRQPKRIMLVSGVILILSSAFMMRIETNNYLMDDLDADEPIKMDFNFLDDHYGGVRPIELAVTLKDTNRSFWDLEVLQQVDRIESYLEKDVKAKLNLSLVQYIRVMNQSANLGNEEFFALPESKRMLKKLRKPIRMAKAGELYRLVVDSTGTVSRISASIPDWGNIRVKAIADQFHEFLDREIDSNLIDVKWTGTAHLLDRNMSYLSGSLLWGIMLSILIVTLIMGIVYRSFKMVLISLIPNILPLIVLGGLMGLLGIDLKISTAIIFTISFGIAVDDTIHFLSKLRLELAKGRSMLYALKRTYLVTGKAMIITSLILCSGFLMLLFSSFVGTFVMGMMISITLFVALIADLTLLPVLLYLFYRPKK